MSQKDASSSQMYGTQGNIPAAEPSLGQSHTGIAYEATWPDEVIRVSANRAEKQVLGTKAHPTVRVWREKTGHGGWDGAANWGLRI